VEFINLFRDRFRFFTLSPASWPSISFICDLFPPRFCDKSEVNSRLRADHFSAALFLLCSIPFQTVPFPNGYLSGSPRQALNSDPLPTPLPSPLSAAVLRIALWIAGHCAIGHVFRFEIFQKIFSLCKGHPFRPFYHSGIAPILG